MAPESQTTQLPHSRPLIQAEPSCASSNQRHPLQSMDCRAAAVAVILARILISALARETREARHLLQDADVVNASLARCQSGCHDLDYHKGCFSGAFSLSLTNLPARGAQISRMPEPLCICELNAIPAARASLVAVCKGDRHMIIANV